LEGFSSSLSSHLNVWINFHSLSRIFFFFDGGFFLDGVEMRFDEVDFRMISFQFLQDLFKSTIPNFSPLLFPLLSINGSSSLLLDKGWRG